MDFKEKYRKIHRIGKLSGTIRSPMLNIRCARTLHEVENPTERAGMFVRKTLGPRTATLPDGSILSLADLPAPGQRWVARRKAIVVMAIEHGLLARDVAINRYNLSDEELEGWFSSIRDHGFQALKIKSLQQTRRETQP